MKPEETFRNEVDSLNKHDPDAFAKVFGPGAVVNDPQYSEPLRGDAIKKDISDFFAAFPDLSARLESTMIDGNAYAVEWSMAGTHTGPLAMPSGDIAATNKRMETRGASFGRLDDQGRIVEERRYYDIAGMMAQLGLME
jgi:steroid delta-isomerase-like uncharacterized protein